MYLKECPLGRSFADRRAQFEVEVKLSHRLDRLDTIPYVTTIAMSFSPSVIYIRETSFGLIQTEIKRATSN